MLRTILAFILTTTAAAQPPTQLVHSQTAAAFRALLPTVTEPAIQKLLQADDLIFYTEDEVPRAYQLDNTFHDAFHNLSGEFDPLNFGNGNREFPWGEPGGTHLVPNLAVFRFLQLPKANGRYLPIVYWNEPLPEMRRDSNTGSTWRWMYPIGTTFGEMLGTYEPNGYIYPFELRFRFRSRDQWDVEVFRPFPEAKDLVKKIAEVRPQWGSDPQLVQLMSSLQNPPPRQVVRLRDLSGKGFNREVRVHPLPPIGNDDLAARLLIETPWRSAMGYTWKEDPSTGESITAPTATGGGLHIVPQGYAAHGFGTDQAECMLCHKHTNRAVSTFENNRGWYGRIRGSDGIFSFHPLAKESISSRNARLPVRMRPELTRAKLVERFDATVHTAEFYSRQDASIYREGP